MKSFITKFRIYFIVLLFILPSVLSLFAPGLPPTHDGEYHIIRFFEFDKVLRSGVPYPIWAPDLNYTYGSPLFLYVYPLPNYIASFFHSLGFSFIDAFKLNLILATVIGAIGMYIYGNYKFGKWGGLLASVSYTYAPYHLLDIYVRGSVGEVWALAFFPLFLYFFDVGIVKKNISFSLFAGIVFSLIIFSHNILSVMFLGFIICYAVFQVWLLKSFKGILLYLVVPIISGFLLSAIFILPALFEQDYVTGLKVFNVFDHFPEVYQLLFPSWGSGYSGISNGTQMSFQIGAVNIFVVLLIIFGLFRKKTDSRMKKYIVFFTFMFFVITFLTTPFSRKLWEFFSFMQVFQFPWRFLSIVIFCTAILTGSITALQAGEVYKSKVLYVLILLFIILTTFSYTKAPYFHDRSDEFYTKNENFIYGTNSIGNAFQTKWLPQQSELPKTSAMLSSSGKNISSRVNLPTQQDYKIELSNPDTLIINTAYFPGWKASVNGKHTDVINLNGVISIDLPEGKHEVKLYLSDTIIRSIAKIISIVAFVVIILMLTRKSVTIK